MNKNILLTIGIPTFNGATYLKQTIDSILNQMNSIDIEEIEILISINASTDNTIDISKEYHVKYPNIFSYYINSENIGFDRNVDLTVNRSKGKFVWILSDDDILQKGALKKVLSVIRQYPQVVSIFVNYENGINLKTEEDCLCSNGNEFFYKSVFKNGLISSNIVCKETWVKLSLEKYLDSGWIHIGFSVDAFSRNQVFIITGKYVKKGGEVRWGSKGSFIQTGLEFVDIFKNIEQKGYNKKIKKQADYTIKRGYPKNIIKAKIYGLKVNMSLIMKLCRLYKQYTSFWFRDLLLFLIPGPVYAFSYKIFKLIKGNKRYIK